MAKNASYASWSAGSVAFLGVASNIGSLIILVYHDGSEVNSDANNAVINKNTFKINDSAIAIPDGMPADFTFDGFHHYCLTGQVFTATVRVYKALVASVDNAKWGVNPL